MDWIIYLWPLAIPAVVLGFLNWRHNLWRRDLRRSWAAEEARRAARTPEQVEMEGRAACVAMCGFDPGPSVKGEAE